MCEFCRGFHLKPAEGYFNASPGARLGTDLKKSIQSSFGCSLDNLTPACGYSIISDNKIRHLGAVSIEKARRVAMSMGNDTTIAEAVGFIDYNQLVWRKIERIDRTQGGQFLDGNGKLMLKLSPTAQIEDLSDAYAKKLKTEYSKWAKIQLDEYFEQLDVDWYDVEDVEGVFQHAGESAIINESDVKSLSAAWGAAALLFMNRSAAHAREFAKSTFLPKIGSGITNYDQKAMEFLAKQPGFFLRDQLGRVNAGLSKHGAKIVQRGIRDGIGYKNIGQNLRSELPQMWGKYGSNYANLVANVGVQRSRAFARVSSFVEAGIDLAELVAVIDHRTTDTCRFLDGQVIRVNNVVEILNRTLQIDSPEEISQVSPWISTKPDPQTGMPQLVTGNGVVIADILRSGRGVLGDGGEYRARKMGDQLATDADIGPPPYHPYCRTEMNPVVKMFSVPPRTWMLAIPTVPLNPKKADGVITPSYMRGLTGAAYVNSIGASDRPFTTGSNPTSERGVRIGDEVDPYTSAWAEDGWLDAMDADEQVPRGVENALSRLSKSLSDAYRAKKRMDLSYKQKGRIIRSIFEKRIKKINASTTVNMEKADINIKVHDRVLGDMPRIDAQKVRKYALEFLSSRLLRVVARRKFPRIVENRSPKGRPTGYWDREENVFYLPKQGTAKARAVALRVFAEYFDTFGHNGEASVIARNQTLASNVVHNVNGVLYLDVATPSFFDGLIHEQTGEIQVDATTGTVKGTSPDRSEWSKSALECLADGFETNLGFLWDTAPNHVAYLLAYIEGRFV